jgi:FADH2 O2-dependent halogenase
MIRESADVLVLGAGFAGSITALLLRRIGRRVVLVDRDAHPRFAIGESSTPLADLTLRRLATQYDLPRLLPLTRYGDWKRTYPQIRCGLKRGFSYFTHSPDRNFYTDAAHSHELLVAASTSDDRSDTHWLRADADAFLAEEAVHEGVAYFDRTMLSPTGREPWVWCGERSGEAVEISARFVIAATGPSGLVAQAVGAVDRHDELLTNSRSLFAHVTGLRRWENVLAELGISQRDHTFPCDAAALHQVLDEGWMWQLRFDHGVTSIGFLIDHTTASSPPQVEWDGLVARYPSLARQLDPIRIVDPPGGLQSTGRLQRRWVPAAGPAWALLPGAAGFIDPLHSTGIAHSLFGIERLVSILAEHWGRESLAARLAEYDRRVQSELLLIDRLVAACYATRRRPAAFVAAVMLYFTAVTTCERRVLAGESPAFLAADDSELTSALVRSTEWLATPAATNGLSDAALRAHVRGIIAPWNRVGLLSPEIPNMYRHTVPR